VSGEADIQPTPSSEEAAAIAAVLRLLREAKPASAASTRSNWQRAARREGLRRALPHQADGWGRAE